MYLLPTGSGCGLAGLSLLLRGCEVTFTDLPEVMYQLTMTNVRKSYDRFISNGSVHPVRLRHPKLFHLDWTIFGNSLDSSHMKSLDNGDTSVIDLKTRCVHPLDERSSEPVLTACCVDDIATPYDMILCTDCVFSIEVSKDLIHTINMCSGLKTTVFCCYETRDEVNIR